MSRKIVGSGGVVGAVGDVVQGVVDTILGAVDVEPNWDNYFVGARVGALPFSSFKALQGTLVQAASATPKTKITSVASRLNAGITIKHTPKGRAFTSLSVNPRPNHNPAQTLNTTRQVAKRAQDIGQQTIDKVNKAEAAAKVKTAKAAKVVGATTSVSTASRAAAAAAAAAAKTASLGVLKQHATQLIKSGKDLAAHANKYQKTVDNMVVKKATNAAAAQRATGIHGDLVGEYFTDILGLGDPTWEEICGEDAEFFAETMAVSEGGLDRLAEQDSISWEEIQGDAYGSPMPDPTNPGFLTNGMPDPSYGSPTGGIMDSSMMTMTTPAPSLASQLPGAPDYGAGQPPQLAGDTIMLSDGTTWPQPNIDFIPDPYPNGDDPTFYDCPTDDSLPLGAIVFDGSRQPPHLGLGHYTIFWGVLPGAGAPKGGPFSGDAYHGDGKWWGFLAGTQPSTNYSGGRNFDTIANPDAAMVYEGQKNNYGPLIGAPPNCPNPDAPKGSWTAGLRFSPSGPNGPRWFWFWDKAPTWAKAAVLQAKLNDVVTQYKAAVVAGQTDYVNAQLQDKLNAQAAAAQAASQAATDAQTAQQMQVANTQAAVQQTAIQTQMAQQQAAQQAAMAQVSQQQAALRQQAQQLQLQYFQQHPEDIFTAQPDASDGGGGEEWGGGGDEGGGDYGGDQGLSLPGGDDGGSLTDEDVDWTSNTSERF